MSPALALVLAAACGPLPAAEDSPLSGAGADDLQVHLDLAPDVPTVARVRWTPPPGATVHVEFGEDTTYGRTARPTADAPDEALLFGLPADTAAHLRLVVEDADGVWTTDDIPWRTGPAPATLPTFHVKADTGGDWGEFVLLSVIFEEAPQQMGSAAVVVDRQGRPVWWSGPVPQELHAARRSADGRAILTSWLASGDPREEGGHPSGVTRVGLDGTVEHVWAAPGAHHDFLEIDPEHVLMPVLDVREVDGIPLAGDALVEVDAVGGRREVWNAWDTLAPEVHLEWDTPLGVDAVDWTHVNAVARDPARDLLVVSLYWLQTLLWIDPADGAVVAALGGPDSTWALSDAARFGPQHAPVLDADGGLLLFDNGFLQGAPSRVLALDLDDEAATAAVDWAWSLPGPANSTFVEGDVLPLPGGAVAASFGMQGAFVVLDPDGGTAFELAADRPVVLARGDVW